MQEVLEIYSGGVKRKLGKVRDPLGYIWVILSSRLTNMTSCALVRIVFVSQFCISYILKLTNLFFICSI